MTDRNKPILVAEDRENNRKLLAILLEQARYEVRLATDWSEALDRMCNETFDAVVTDWEMPGLTGSEFLALSQVLWPDTPVIVVSAHVGPYSEAVPQGVFAWLRKPYESEKLLQVLEKAVQTSAHRLGHDPSRPHLTENL